MIIAGVYEESPIFITPSEAKSFLKIEIVKNN